MWYVESGDTSIDVWVQEAGVSVNCRDRKSWWRILNLSGHGGIGRIGVKMGKGDSIPDRADGRRMQEGTEAAYEDIGPR